MVARAALARPRAEGTRLARAVCAVGLLSAGVSAYWGVGGTWLLDTLGGGLERLARDRDAPALFLISVVVALKIVAAVLPILLVSGRASVAWTRRLRALAWLEAAILTLYGLVYTVVGLMVQADVLHAPAGSNQRALAWHTYLWDPWFLVWGLLVVAALRHDRSGRASG